MTTATLSAVPPVILPGPHRWTVDEFHRVKESGVWDGRKIILIDGELIEMPAAKPPHDIALMLADYLFKSLFSQGYVVRIQMGMVFNINTDPIPDLAVVPGTPRAALATPTTAELVLEVSDTSLAFDTGEKASLYAAAGIADYWVIDVNGRRVLVHRDPKPDPARKYGHGYATVTVLLPGNALAPLAAPQTPIAAADLLP
jgi:Uma2 family endonuclease